MTMQFTKAQRTGNKARIALVGVSGSGKTYTALLIARGLVGPEGRIAVIDTENKSASLYANEAEIAGEFDTLALETYGPQTYCDAIHAAEAAGYDAIVIDSLSHAWSGKDGALEQVDNAAARSRSNNKFDAWRQVTPQHNALVDAMVHCKTHLVVTMRAKSEYVVETNDKGKNVPRKIGMAPIQRDGMEYEFDVAADMDQEHTLVVTKSRCTSLTDAVIRKPGRAVGEKLRAWLDSADEAPPVTEKQPETAQTNGAPPKAKTKPFTRDGAIGAINALRHRAEMGEVEFGTLVNDAMEGVPIEEFQTRQDFERLYKEVERRLGLAAV